MLKLYHKYHERIIIQMNFLTRWNRPEAGHKETLETKIFCSVYVFNPFSRAKLITFNKFPDQIVNKLKALHQGHNSFRLHLELLFGIAESN